MAAVALWSKIAPKARDITFADTSFAIRDHLTVGVHIQQGEVIDRNKRISSYGFRDIALSATLDQAAYGVGLRAGRFVERGHLLGAKAEGGYELAEGSGSHYLHAAAHRDVGDWRFHARATHITATVDFRHNSFVDDTVITANEAAVGLARHNLFANTDRLNISLALPLAIRSGAITQRTPRGYTADGSYRMMRDHMALRVPSRHRALQSDYQRDLAGGTMWFVSGSLHRNWGNQQGRRNAMLHAGLQLPL